MQAARPAAPPGAPGGLTAGAAAGREERAHVAVAAPAVEGSFSLLGARLDQLVLHSYRETTAKNSPLVQLLEPPGGDKGYYVQFGWTAAPGTDIKLPGTDTVWSATPGPLTPGHPVTLSWNNGAGLVFRMMSRLDDNYMFRIVQQVVNEWTTPVDALPLGARAPRLHARGAGLVPPVRRAARRASTARCMNTPIRASAETRRTSRTGSPSTPKARRLGRHHRQILAGRAGPRPGRSVTTSFRYLHENDGDRYQVDYIAAAPERIPAGRDVAMPSRIFAGAKVVSLLQRYQDRSPYPALRQSGGFRLFLLPHRADLLSRSTG